MQKRNQQTHMLAKLLERFLDSVSVEENELRLISGYLFCSNAIPAFFKDDELQQTIDYLKDIAEENRFNEIEQIMAYLDRSAQRLSGFIADVIELTKNDHDTTEDPLGFAVQMHSAPTHLEFVNSFYEYLHHELDKVRKRDLLLKQLREQMTYSEDNCDYLTVDFISRCSYNMNSGAYLQQFYAYHNREEIYFLHSVEMAQKRIEVWTTADLNFSAKYYSSQLPVLCKYMDDVFIHSVAPSYNVIITMLSTEKPITDNNIKKKLAEWLFYSKFRTVGLESWWQHIGKRESRNLINVCYFHSKEENYVIKELNTFINNLYEEKLSGKKWVILKSPYGKFWLTSDNPGFSINLSAFQSQNHELVADPFLSNISNDTVEYYPLSKDYCLRIQPTENLGIDGFFMSPSPIEFENCTEKELNIVNGLTYYTRRDVVIGGDKEILEQYQPI